MAHIVIRTINGRQYASLEESYRVAGKRTPRKRRIKNLGPVGGGFLKRLNTFLQDNLKPDPNYVSDKALAQLNGIVEAKRATQNAHLKELHNKYGLKLGEKTPTPIEKPMREVIQAPATNKSQDAQPACTAQSDSSQTGQGSSPDAQSPEAPGI